MIKICENCNKQFESNTFPSNTCPNCHPVVIEEHPKKGTKNDSNYMEKPPLDLLTLEFQTGTAQALGFGANKYGRHNFRGGIDHSRLIAAALRHLNQYNNGQDLDSESGLSHLSHAAASLNMLMWMVANRPELDDRYKKE